MTRSRPALLAFCLAMLLFGGVATAQVVNRPPGADRTAGPSAGSGPYLGQPLPGATPQPFAPGIVSRPDTNDCCVTMSPDGREIYFSRNATVMVTRLEPGGWTPPEPAPFSAGFPAGEAHVTRDNSRVYWLWVRPAPDAPAPQKPTVAVWAADRTPGGWSPAVYVGPGMFVSSTNNGEIYVTDLTDRPDGYLARARLADGRFVGFDRLAGGIETLRSASVRNMAHPAVSPDGSYLLFDLGDPPLFVSFRKPDGTWAEAIDLTAHGIPKDAFMAYVSPDGKALFLSSAARDVYWVSTGIIERLRPTLGLSR